MHWDDDQLRGRLEECFETLARDIDAKYGEYRAQSLAFEVVELLGWRTVEAFEDDFVALG